MFAKQVGILMFDWEMAGQAILSLVRICTWLSSVQSLSHVWLSAISWTAAHQASLFITNSQIAQIYV